MKLMQMNTPEHSHSERPPLTGMSPEEEKQEAEQWCQAFLETTERHEKLKANFRLERVLILTENQELKAEYIEKLLSHIEQTTSQKESVEYNDEFMAIHAILTVSESLKEGASPELIKDYAPRLYHFSHLENSVISGMAHQQFLDVLGTLSDKDKKKELLGQLEW